MKVTSISIQAKNKDRVNVSVDGAYRFSLDVFQVGELGIRIGKEYSENELIELETESQFGKLYGRALEYCLMRPHSAKEVRDYLWRKTRETKIRNRKTGEMTVRSGVSQEVADRVYERLIDKRYIDDEAFARFWVEHRNQMKGTSRRKLMNELRTKGVTSSIVEATFALSERTDSEELRKVIAKKQRRYPDEQKFLQYLVRQGFAYDDCKQALLENSESSER